MRPTVLLAAAGLTLAACGGDDTAVPPTTDTSVISTTTSPSTVPDADGADWITCESPAGFSVDHPSDWHSNAGDAVDACTLFDPEPFTVPDSTDARVADISVYVDEVSFADYSTVAEDEARALTTIDGHQAVRLAGTGDELHGDDVAHVRYLVDLTIDRDDEPRTLVADVVAVEGIDFDAGVTVLDDMVRTLELPGEAVAVRYHGGGTPFTVTATADHDDVCLGVDPSGVRTCLTEPSADALRAASLSRGTPDVFGGVTGDGVHRVEVDTTDGTQLYLPSDTSIDGVRAWALGVDPDTVTSLRWYGTDGRQIGQRDRAEDEIEPVGPLATDTVTSPDFPASGPPALLGDVRIGVHDGFDRVVFELHGNAEAVSYEVALVDEVRATSGDEVEVGGRAMIEVTMTPASGVDLSGDEPRQTYDGPDRLDPTMTEALTEVVLVEDFESMMRWAVGVVDDTGFAVRLLDHPLRLVVDVESAP